MTRRLLSISFSLFLVSALMGTFPVPATHSVSIPTGAVLSDSAPVPAKTTAIPATIATIKPVPAAATNMTEAMAPSSSSSAAAAPELIRTLKGEGLADKDRPVPLAPSSGLYKTIVPPSSATANEASPQKRAQTGQQSGQQWWQQSAQQQWSPPPQQQQGQQWYPPQQQGQGQWHPPQQQQQWYPPQQQQQWYPPQQQQQWQHQDRPSQPWQPSAKQQKQIQKRAAAVGAPTTPTDTSASAPSSASSSAQGGAGTPTYRLSALVCNYDTKTRGLLHCSDGQDYYTLQQPPNPANSVDPRNRAWSSSAASGQTSSSVPAPGARTLRKRAVNALPPDGIVGDDGYNVQISNAYAIPQAGQGQASSQGWFRRSQPYARPGQASTLRKRTVNVQGQLMAAGGAEGQSAANTQGWFRRPQPYAQPGQPTASAAAADVPRRGATAIPEWYFQLPKPGVPSGQPTTPAGATGGGVGAKGTPVAAVPEAWFRRPQPYDHQGTAASQSQAQTQVMNLNKRSIGAAAAAQAQAMARVQSQTQVMRNIKRATGPTAFSGGAGAGSAAATAAANQAQAQAGQAQAQANEAQVAAISVADPVQHTHDHQGGLTAGGGAGSLASDSGDWSKYSGSGSNWGGGHCGKKGWGGDYGDWSKYSDSGSDWGGKKEWDDGWSHARKGKGEGGKPKHWNKRQVGNGPGGPAGASGRTSIPVPIDVGLIWDGTNVNLVPPTPGSVPLGSGGLGGLGRPGGPGGAGGAGGTAIPVPINIDTLVYPDGQMEMLPPNSI
ncbi:hypothetical protein BGX29_007148 [Mortierella sp. GBA35]|nr:hypothetical protein BGX29_007148 [Mortierella sp. GBA35]